MTRRRTATEIAAARAQLLKTYADLPPDHPGRHDLSNNIIRLSIAEQLARIDRRP